MAWAVEYTDEFERWWGSLSEAEHESLFAGVRLIEEFGPALGSPHSSKIKGARTSHLRELRVQHEGRPYRLFYAFNPSRTALLLIGGDKTGDDRFYERLIPIADALYAEHLKELREEGRGP
jgi:hypothetical protein